MGVLEEKKKVIKMFLDDLDKIFEITHELLMKENIKFEGIPIKGNNFNGGK